MTMARLAGAAGAVLLWLTGAASGQAAGATGEPARVALVIGNESYAQATLGNATSDALAVADVLREGGFEVVFAENAQKAQINASIATFAQRLERGVIAVVYFSGHAIQYQGRNFLVPLDAKIASGTDVRREAIDVDLILDPLIVARPAGSVVILDAGRSNPWQQAVSARVRGLAADGPINGVVLIYPATPGSVVGSDNTFAAELVKAMKIPGLKFENVFRRTRAAVMRASHDQQAPWESSVATNELVVTPDRPATAKFRTRTPDPVELGFWNTIKNSDKVADLQAYLDSYPEGQFATLARARLKQLGANDASRPSGEPAQVANPERAGGNQAPYQDCPRCPELILIPGGTFKMGSSEMFDFERPVHQVSIGKPFYIGRREVTFQEWDACVDDGGCNYRPDDRGLGRGMRPVTDLNWNDTRAYLAWLSRKTGRTYRLPSESEWEYAARAGSTTTYLWGKTVEKDRANCIGCTAEPLNKAIETGSYPPNGYGLFDMAGNAAEWVEDCWTDSYRAAPTDGSAWTRPQCREHVLRGGSFNNDPRYLRSAARLKYDFDVRYYANGFRVVREQ
jgi:formylglycine-generating enzyme required for sulfatase activity